MENKYNIGEPVAIYAWIKSISSLDGKLVYSIEVKDGDKPIAGMYDVPEELITTVF